MQYKIPAKLKLVGESRMLRSVLSIVLSLLLMGMPASGAPAGDQPAGQVKALIPDASRNSQPLAVKDTLQWNDVLKTNAKGRLRAVLTDGSILSLGSDGELRVVQHDANSQQTSIEMSYGKLRNQVVKITQPGGKYEVKTPNVLIGVIGTDFYVAYDNNQTTVICYVGRLSVTPTAGTKEQNSNAGTSNAITLNPGQMVTIGENVPPGGYQVSPAPSSAVKTSMLDTNVPDQLAKKAHPHLVRNIVIAATVVTAGLTVAMTQVNSSQKPCGCK